jgi:hypothetical protein
MLTWSLVIQNWLGVNTKQEHKCCIGTFGDWSQINISISRWLYLVSELRRQVLVVENSFTILGGSL